MPNTTADGRPKQLKCDAATLARLAQEFFAQGKRTVSYQDYVDRYGRAFDAPFVAKVVDLLPSAAQLLESRGVAVTLVNDYCLRHHAETPVVEMAEARRCNLFNSGGKPASGIRRAMDDDLVRSEYNGSQSHLAIGSLSHAVQHSVNDVAAGVSAPETHRRLVSTLRNKLPEIPEQTADAQPQELFDGE